MAISDKSHSTTSPSSQRLPSSWPAVQYTHKPRTTLSALSRFVDKPSPSPSALSLSDTRSVTSRGTHLSTRSSKSTWKKKRRLAFSKPLTADKQLYIPRHAMLWDTGDGGTCVRSTQTGNPILLINSPRVVSRTRGRSWRSGIMDAILSEVDPSTKQVGKIVALVRDEGIKFAIYTYFRAYEGQLAAYRDTEFYQGKLFRYGELTDNKRRCTFAMATAQAEFCGRDVVTTQLQVTSPPPLVANDGNYRTHWNLEVRDVNTQQVQISRGDPNDENDDVVTLRSGTNLLVATALCLAAETVMNA